MGPEPAIKRMPGQTPFWGLTSVPPKGRPLSGMVTSSDVVSRVTLGSIPGASAAFIMFLSLGAWCPQATASERQLEIIKRHTMPGR